MKRLLLSLLLILPAAFASAAEVDFGVALPQIGKLDTHGKKIKHMVLSRDGRWVAGLSEDLHILIWDMNTRKLTKTIKTGAKTWMHWIVISPDGKKVAGAAQDTLYMWDTKKGRRKTLWKGPGHSFFSTSGGVLLAFRIKNRWRS